jgi:hypothetical protein
MAKAQTAGNMCILVRCTLNFYKMDKSDNDEKSADTEGGTAQITILDKGESRLISASHNGKNSFVARIEGSVSQGAKLVITGTLKDKRTFVGRFEVK